MPNMRVRGAITTMRDGKKVHIKPGTVFDFTDREIIDISKRAPRHIQAIKAEGKPEVLKNVSTGPSVSGDRNAATIRPGNNPDTSMDDAEGL